LKLHDYYEPEMALLRLTGAWGQPADGVRLLFLPPERATVGKSIPAAVLIENAGDKDIDDILPFYFGASIVDGKRHDIPMGAWDGATYLSLGDVWVRPLDLKDMIATPGKHEIQYQAGNTKSNVLTIDVSAKEDK